MAAGKNNKKLTPDQTRKLLDLLKTRFEQNMHRHPQLQWPAVLAKLQQYPEKIWSLSEMERTGGQPDVITHDKDIKQYLFVDCSPESPAGRRSLCYDRTALDSRKENKPAGSALDMAAAMGIDLLTEPQYRHLQTLGHFDAKTSSWIETPPAIRKLGGAIFCDYRYEQVFVYHNGASSYYAARGFRGALTF